MPEQPLAVRSYQSRSVPFSQQRLLNAYVEVGSESTKSTSVVYGTPGTNLFSTVGVGPIRGQEVMAEILYVVSGADLFEVSSTGVTTNRGNIGGTDTVTMANNGFQLCVVSNRKGFIYDKDTAVFTKITFAGGFAPDSVTYIDGFFIFNDRDRLFSSALLDGLTYDALDFTFDDYDPDTSLRVFADHGELWSFGPNATTPWFNVGGTAFPFAPIDSSELETGILSKNSVTKQDNSLFWFAIDKRGGRYMARANGYTPIRVSTHALEKKWDEFANPETAISFSYSQEGHRFVVLVLPGAGTYVYDITSNEWHERESFGDSDWRMRNFALAYNKRLVGDSKSGKIFELDLDVFTEDASTIERIMIGYPLDAPSNNNVRHNFFRIDIDGGVGLTTGQGSDPVIMLSWANDGSPNFNNEKFMPIGKIGDFTKRVFKRGLGKARQRVYKIRMTDPVKFSVKGMYFDAEEGSW